jgi:hypothetical protein
LPGRPDFTAAFQATQAHNLGFKTIEGQNGERVDVIVASEHDPRTTEADHVGNRADVDALLAEAQQALIIA